MTNDTAFSRRSYAEQSSNCACSCCIDGRALEYASDELKNDREIVPAVKQTHGRALELRMSCGMIAPSCSKHETDATCFKYATEIKG